MTLKKLAVSEVGAEIIHAFVVVGDPENEVSRRSTYQKSYSATMARQNALR
jgi:hypothetical protein